MMNSTVTLCGIQKVNLTATVLDLLIKLNGVLICYRRDNSSYLWLHQMSDIDYFLPPEKKKNQKDVVVKKKPDILTSIYYYYFSPKMQTLTETDVLAELRLCTLKSHKVLSRTHRDTVTYQTTVFLFQRSSHSILELSYNTRKRLI